MLNTITMKTKYIVVHPLSPNSHDNCNVMSLNKDYITSIGSTAGNNCVINMLDNKRIITNESYEDILKVIES